MIERAALNIGTRVFGCRYCAPVSEVAPQDVFGLPYTDEDWCRSHV